MDSNEFTYWAATLSILILGLLFVSVMTFCVYHGICKSIRHKHYAVFMQLYRALRIDAESVGTGLTTVAPLEVRQALLDDLEFRLSSRLLTWEKSGSALLGNTDSEIRFVAEQGHE